MRVLGSLALFFFFSLFSVESNAYSAVAEDCRAIITKNYIKESAHYRLSPDNYSVPNFGNDHVGKSYFFVRKLIEELGCSKKAVNFSKGPNGRGQSRCHQIFRGKEHTRACYVHTNLGFFFVTTDLTDGINLLYNRWD